MENYFKAANHQWTAVTYTTANIAMNVLASSKAIIVFTCHTAQIVQTAGFPRILQDA
jgi:hypothetical protein